MNWLEGILFKEENSKGYLKTELRDLFQGDILKPAYGGYSLALGDFDHIPGEDVAIGIPRGLEYERFTDSNNKSYYGGSLNGKVESK